MDFTTYTVPVIVGICLIVGYIIKKWISDVDNKYIPTICAILGVVICVWLNGFKFTPDILLTGLVSGLSSTGMHQTITQYLNKEKKV